MRLARANRTSPLGPLPGRSLFGAIYKPAEPGLPESVSDALLALSLARERYLVEHAAGRRAARSR